MNNPSDSFILFGFSCMLPVLGKSNALKEALEEFMPVPPKAGVAAALMASACAFPVSESPSTNSSAELSPPVRFVVTDYFYPKLLPLIYPIAAD